MTKQQQQCMLTKGYTIYKNVNNNTIELALNQKNTLVSPMAQQVKKSACSAGNAGQSLGWEDPLKEEMTTYYSILA